MILADGRWVGAHGIGRFAHEVLSRIPEARLLPDGVPLLHPLEPVWLAWELIRHRPDVYFSPGFNPPLLATVPLVFTIHDLNHIQFGGNASFSRTAYYRWHIRPSCRRAFRVLTGSEFSRRCILDWAGIGEERVVNVGYGVSSAFRADGERHAPGFPYLLYVGNRRAHKNVPGLFRGFALSGVDESVKLVLSGDPDAQTEELAHRLKLNGRVVYTGEVSDETLARYYRGALVLVLPSLYEGFGLPVVEAMACGTPVIASNIPALRETARDAALLVDPGEAESIADAVRQVASDSGLRGRLREKGPERARAFSWDATAARVRNVLSDALGR
jgi:glycosyltransferase involved in cell wall biosynthesis